MQAEPGIRQIITQEDPELIDLDDSRFLFILNFQRRGDAAEQPNVIDPVAEQQRLRAARPKPGDHRADGQPAHSPQ